MTAVRAPITVRLDADTKALFSECATRAGLEPGVAARQLLDLFVARLKSMPRPDYIVALGELNDAFKPQEQPQ